MHSRAHRLELSGIQAILELLSYSPAPQIMVLHRPIHRRAVLAALAVAALYVTWRGGSVVYAGIRAERMLASWCAEDYQLDGSSNSVFAPGKVLTFEFVLDDGALDQMWSDPKAEHYVPARLKVGVLDQGLVGLRFKGSVGTLFHFSDEKLKSENPPKLSLKVHFGKYVKGARFQDLKRINLHSMSNDDSLFRDRLAYSVFRESGVKAPRCGHARVLINGKYAGVFSLVEQIDREFIDSCIGDAGQGVLYKETWPRFNKQDRYTRKIKSNPANRDASVMVSFAEDLAAAQDSELVAAASRWCDMDSMLRYFVVDQVLRNWDGACCFASSRSKAKKVFYNHNCYWYQSSSDRFALIPWDLDRTMVFEHEYTAVPSFYDLNVSEDKIYAGINEVIVVAPACNPLIRAVALYARGRYVEEVTTVLRTGFAQDALNAQIDAWCEEIQHAVALDPHLDYERWEHNVKSLRIDIARIHEWMAEVVRDIETREAGTKK